MKLLPIALSLCLAAAASAKDCLVYFGTFTNQLSKGIYVSRLDVATGKLTPPELAAETPSPNFLAVSPNGKFLYAATRVEELNGVKGGAVSAFVIDAASGKLSLLNQKSSGGRSPCHVSVDATGKAVFVANFHGGSVKSLPVNADGSLGDGGTFIQHRGVDTNRPVGPRGHWMAADPSNRYALACDLGLDKVMIYKLDATAATLATNDPPSASVPSGAGARHLAFGHDGRFVYVLNEMACSVTTFAWDSAKGKLDALETIPALPKSMTVQTNFSAAEIAVRADGRFVYATIRGHDSISVLATDAKSGKLAFVENVPAKGKVPRGMGIDPTGRWLIVANQRSDSAAVFGIDTETGRLTPTGQELQIGSPVDVKFVEAR